MALFGTDGARGIANQDLTVELAMRIGQAAAGLLEPGSIVVIGRDTRISGPMLEAALTAGLTTEGVHVVMAGVIPTPALGYLIDNLNARAGVMISASHNPPEYNGIKLLNRGGRKWPTELESRVEEGVRDPKRLRVVGADQVGAVTRSEALALARYQEYLLSIFEGRIRSMKVVVDVAHGAAITTAAPILRALGLSLVMLNDEPDGRHINQHCGATHPQVVRDAVLAEGADVGLSFDGDADRLIAVDETGHIVDGDEILYVLARALKAEQALAGDTVVATVMSNLGLEKALGRIGIRLERTPVGDRWVAARMRDAGFMLGGEQSGHIIQRQWAETGDGLLTALAVLAQMSRQERPLSALVGEVERYPQVLHNVSLPRPITDWPREIPGLMEMVDAAQTELGEDGRVLIRPSGTEPLLRIMLEGRDASQIGQWADRMVTVVSEALQSAKA